MELFKEKLINLNWENNNINEIIQIYKNENNEVYWLTFVITYLYNL